MKTNPWTRLETPPPELAAGVMQRARAWRGPARVGWLLVSQTVVLCALLLANAATLPRELMMTAENLRVWGNAVAQATLESSDSMGELLRLDFGGELL